MLWFYGFMAVCMLLIPATMLFFGYFWKKRPPKDVNAVYGYRTRRSTFSKRTWDYAHLVCSRLWRRLGWLSLILTAAAIVAMCLLCKTEAAVGTWGGIAVMAQIVLMIAAIPFTERAIKEKFGI